MKRFFLFLTLFLPLGKRPFCADHFTHKKFFGLSLGGATLSGERADYLEGTIFRSDKTARPFQGLGPVFGAHIEYTYTWFAPTVFLEVNGLEKKYVNALTNQEFTSQIRLMGGVGCSLKVGKFERDGFQPYAQIGVCAHLFSLNYVEDGIFENTNRVIRPTTFIGAGFQHAFNGRLWFVDYTFRKYREINNTFLDPDHMDVTQKFNALKTHKVLAGVQFPF